MSTAPLIPRRVCIEFLRSVLFSLLAITPNVPVQLLVFQILNPGTLSDQNRRCCPARTGSSRGVLPLQNANQAQDAASVRRRRAMAPGRPRTFMIRPLVS